MHRFYLSQKVSGNEASISDAGQMHHLRDVLRLKAGDEVVVFDSAGIEYLGVIFELDKKQAVIKIKSRKPSQPKNLEIEIACAIPKKSRMDDIIDKLTQLGVDAIVPMDTERVTVKLDDNRDTRLERWRKIALNAAEQSRRNNLPRLYPVMGLKEILARAGEFDLKLVPTLAGPGRPLKDVLAEFKPSRILVLIGPEGDFTTGEIKQALNAGFIPISLGNTVLRVETAAVAIASYLRLAFL